MPQLPQELIDAILEDVPDSSLGACSMTARAFVVTSQRRLFHWMSLVGTAQYERTDRLFEDSPHLAGYMRYVALNIGGIPHDYGTLSRILDRLYSVERISISGTNTAITSQLSVLDFFARLSIKCLALDALLDVSSSLLSGAFKYLEEVVLSNLNIIQVEEDPDATDTAALSSLTLSSREVEAADDLPVEESHAPPRAAIRQLNITTDSAFSILTFTLDPTRTVSLQHLTRLSVVFPPVPQLTWAGPFSTLLRACSPTLKHLELELEAIADVALPVLPQVNVLVLWLDAELTKTPDPLAAIVSSTTSSTPHLSSLTLAIVDRPHPAPSRWIGARPWTFVDLDALLVDELDLHQAHLELRYFVPDLLRYAVFVAYFSENLARTANEGLLRFSHRAALEHPMDRFADAEVRL
ncbi:hypothetical protein B0H16DRAFT_1470036 [Mycena metata]|uniref:F-box domain-containing protein n=1 Tax=Mycena metata TaxID=1033252 RepID=A0AAD7MS01_9AGAR|nr:hypothetical protein B0H16DRAFT_1470036 [Mycena metata]